MRGRPKTGLKSLVPAGIALLIAVLLALLAPRWSVLDRLTNLDLENQGVADTYILFTKSTPGRCHVLTRREATMRRSDTNLKGASFHYERFRGAVEAGGLDSWLVRSKTQGTIFFVPVEEVPDWGYPFLYQFVRRRCEGCELPAARWTQLFVNRIYQGLYLRMRLPFDPRKKDGGGGILRELLSVVGDRLSKVDTRFDDAGRLYLGRLAVGAFPALAPAPASLAWLAQRRPTAELTLLLANDEPFQVSLLPLPLSLPALHEALHGRAAATLIDERCRRWSAGLVQGPAASTQWPLSAAQRDTLHLEFGAYDEHLREALRDHGRFHRRSSELRAELPARQAALADLGLRMGEL